MFKSIVSLFANAALFFMDLPTGKKIALMVAGALVLTGLIVLSVQTRKPDFEVLFSKLSSEDLGAIAAQLKERKINFKIAAGETAILVPARDVFDLRIQLASEGLPRGGGVGFEIFDKTTLGMSEFIQKLNLMRATTGELTRTINSLDVVDSARVHIAAPKRSVFLEDERKTTASVVLKLKRRLSPGQVQGIVHLVASSVEGLNPEDVTIVDTKGNILAGGEEHSTIAMMTSNQLEFKQSVANIIENRILSMLGSVLGREKITAKVSADVNFKQTEQTEEIYDPESQVARSEQRSEESTVGSTPVGGIVGAAANQPGGNAAQISQSATPAKSEKLSETINYEINKITKRTINPVGEIKKLSVAVMIDGTYDEDSKYVPRTAGEMQQYKKIVERAVGYDEDRGDEIEVVNVAFDISKVKEEKIALEKAEKAQLWISIARHGVTAIFIILLFVMLIKPLINWLSTAAGEGMMMVPGVRMVRGKMVPGMPGEKEEEEEEKTKEIKKIKKKEDYRAVVLEYAQDNAAHTAELVRKWLKERR